MEKIMMLEHEQSNSTVYNIKLSYNKKSYMYRSKDQFNYDTTMYRDDNG